MKRPQSPLLKNERGQSLVEFALTLPMLLVVMFMVTEFGRALYQYNVLAQAVRAAAREAAVAGDTLAPTVGVTYIDDFLGRAGISPGDLTVKDVQVVNDYNGTGTKVVIATVSMPFRWILQGDMPTNPGPQSSTVAPGAFTLTAENIMKAEF